MTSINFEQLEEDWPRFRKDIANLKVQIRELKEAENEVRQDTGDLVPLVHNVKVSHTTIPSIAQKKMLDSKH
jgi:hypothetical protein